MRGVLPALRQNLPAFPKLQGRRQVRTALHPPPRSPMRTDVSRSLTNSPQFAGISAGSNAGRAVSVAGRGRDSLDFGSRSLGCPNPFLAQVRQDQIDKPSIAYWRDHSAGASRRRVTPMPRGSRPSTAAFTSSGARNPTRSRKSGDKTAADRVGNLGEHDWDRAG